jgi:hypothetical protein
MRSIVAQLSALWFVTLCVASSAIGIIAFPTVMAVAFDLIGVSTEAPLSDFVGWSMLVSAAVGLVLPTTMLMSSRGDFERPLR